jgi:hypothetical protein
MLTCCTHTHTDTHTHTLTYTYLLFLYLSLPLHLSPPRSQVSELKGDQYSGNWQKDKKHGFGKYVWSDGDVYEGEVNINNQRR